MKTTINELKDLFRLTDDRQIRKTLYYRIRYYSSDNIEIIDPHIEELLTKFREGGNMNLGEVCKEFNISTSAVMGMIKEKLLPHYCLTYMKGSAYLFLRSDIEKCTTDINIFKVGVVDFGKRICFYQDLVCSFAENTEFFTDRDVEIFTLFYVENKTIEKISDLLQLSRERVRQLINRIGRRLVRIICGWVNTYKTENKYKKLYDDLQFEYDQISSENEYLNKVLLNFSPQDIKKKVIDAKVKEKLLTQINDLDLSVRLYNCLRSMEIKTIADIVKYSPNDFLEVRDFGKKSFNELKDLISDMDIEWENEITKNND